ncbi:MAG: ATP-binding protein [Proteobacteria bacterium]|nr:ATP-binding protein [Pseudomonadota bacterium]
MRSWVGQLRGVGGSVQVVADPKAVAAEGDVLLGRLEGVGDPLVALLGELRPACASALVLPEPSLVDAVYLLRQPSVQSVVAEDYLGAAPNLLTYLAGKLAWGNIFGVSKLLPWGVLIGTEVITSTEDRHRATTSLLAFVKTLRLRARLCDGVQLVAEELLMNALYDAPVDGQGRPLFGHLMPNQRANVRLERPVTLQYGCDGRRLVISVRDTYGSLRRSSVLDRLEHCAQAADQIADKPSGAGLGLYMVAKHATELMFNTVPGKTTEVIVVLDLAASTQSLRHLGFFNEPNPVVAEGRVREELNAPQGKGWVFDLRYLVLTIAALLLFVVAGLVFLWPYLVPGAPPHGG